MKRGTEETNGVTRGWVAVIGLLACAGLGSQLSAQSNVQEKTEREIPDQLGYHIARLNDVDGDKCADFAVDDGEGNAWVVSGKDGHALARGKGLPLALTTLGGDVDGDGVWDIAMWNGFTLYGHRDPVDPVLCSGKDLHEIRRCRRPDGWEYKNGAVAAAGDWNGDGKPDLVFGTCALLVFSGANGEVLHEVKSDREWSDGYRLTLADIDHDGHADILQGTLTVMPGAERGRLILPRPALASQGLCDTSTGHYVGQTLGFVPDTDGDGWDDVLLSPEPSSRGAVIVSSRSAKPLRELPSPLGEAAERVSFALLDDLDHDGMRDFAVAYDFWLGGAATIYSGKSGVVLRRHKQVAWQGPDANVSANGHFAVSIFALGDTDGDGMNDYAIGAGGGVENLAAGCFSIYSGKTGELRLVVWKKTLEKQ